jgi:autotransporter-associated beta strand protein
MKICPSNRNRFLAVLLGIVSILTLFPGALNAQVTTMYSDTFSGAPASAMNGAVPDTRPGAETWSANSIVTHDGVFTASAGSALLPFDPVANKIYTLSMNVNYVGATAWVALGFTTATSVGATAGASSTATRFSNANVPGYAWFNHNDAGAAGVYEGARTANPIAYVNPGFVANRTLTIVLNTAGDGNTFTADFLVDGSSITSGPQLIDAVTVAGINAVGFSISGTGLAGSTVDNFTLTEESLPAYPVTYDGNGSDGGTPPTDGNSPYVTNQTVTVLGNTGGLTKSGNSFDGWNTAANGSGTAYVAGNTFPMPAAGVTLYAQWSVATATITAPATFPVALNTLIGTASSSTSVAVSGSDLAGDITATAPSGLEVSSDDVTYGPSATISQSGGPLYARLAASAPVGSYDSLNVVLTSPGAANINVATTASGNSVIDTAVWTSTTTPATWGTPGNWLNNVIGTNAGITADFNQVDITADTTVNLTTPLTIGNLIFGDTAPGTAAGWIVADNADPANILTLAGPTPTITVNTLGTGKSATITTEISGGFGLNKAGPGTLVLSGANTYIGATIVSNGTLTLSGNRTATGSAITVGQDANQATLNIQAGSFSFAGNGLNVGTGPVGVTNGIVNQTGGDISFSSGTAVLVGGAGTPNNSGVYKLSGGSITGFSSGNRGVLLGVNADSTGIFELSGTGNLNLPAGYLGIGRSDTTSAPHNTRGAFYQTGGTATINSLGMGSRSPGTNGNAILSLTGGTFASTSFGRFCQGSNDVVTILIGGAADVTLGAFPTTARGVGSTSTITFDGGTIRPAATSDTYLSGLNNAYVTANGANFNVAEGNDITVSQVLEDAPSQVGVLTKVGAGALTLQGTNTYSGGTLISEGILRIGFTGSIHNTAGITNNAALHFNQTSIPLTVNNVISGSGTVTKTGAEVLTLTGANTYTGGTTISNGTLAVNGSLTSVANAVTVAGGTLAGAGSIAGPVTVDSDGTLAPGPSVGTLTINNTLTLQGTNVMEIARDGAVLAKDRVTGISTLNYGGTLVVANVGGSALQVGDSFKLFDAASYSATFANIVYPNGYTFTDNLAVDGTITVASVLVITPPTLVYTPSGGDWVFTWSGSGFKLQAQTNSLAVGLSNNWVDVPGGETSGITVPGPNPAYPAVFFRLISVP